jgi:hypothetical protein
MGQRIASVMTAGHDSPAASPHDRTWPPGARRWTRPIPDPTGFPPLVGSSRACRTIALPHGRRGTGARINNGFAVPSNELVIARPWRGGGCVRNAACIGHPGRPGPPRRSAGGRLTETQRNPDRTGPHIGCVTYWRGPMTEGHRRLPRLEDPQSPWLRPGGRTCGAVAGDTASGVTTGSRFDTMASSCRTFGRCDRADCIKWRQSVSLSTA